MKISSILYGLAAAYTASCSANPIENDTSNKLAGINKFGNSNLLDNSGFPLTVPKDIVLKPEEPYFWYNLLKEFIYPISQLWNGKSNVADSKEFELQGTELPNLFAEDNSSPSTLATPNNYNSKTCPGIIRNNCWDFPAHATKHFQVTIGGEDSGGMGFEFGCKKFKGSNGTTISPTFNVDYTPDSIKPKITSFLSGMKGCDVREVSTGHIVAKNCDSISLNLCTSEEGEHEVDVTISNPSEVEIIGDGCDAGVC